MDELTTVELEELRRSQVVYIDWCTAQMQAGGDVSIYMEKVRMASSMTTCIDAILDVRLER